MKVGDLVLDWYYPGFGLIIDIIEEKNGINSAPKLVKVYFAENATSEWRYEEELVVVGRKKKQEKKEKLDKE